MSGKWDFIANSVNQSNLAADLKTAEVDFEAKVSEMYGKIGEMGTFWQGADYDAFNDSTKGYQKAISDFADTIAAFGTHFENVSSSTETLARDLTNIINNMTS